MWGSLGVTWGVVGVMGGLQRSLGGVGVARGRCVCLWESLEGAVCVSMCAARGRCASLCVSTGAARGRCLCLYAARYGALWVPQWVPQWVPVLHPGAVSPQNLPRRRASSLRAPSNSAT